MKTLMRSALLLLGVVSVACNAPTASNKNMEVLPSSVETQTIQKQVIANTVDYAANLMAFEQVHYAPSSPGRIAEIYVEVGDPIKKDQLLVLMDQTTLTQARLQLKNLEAEYNRAVGLNQTGSISRQAYDAAVTQYEVSRSNVEFLEQNTRLMAPFDGVVTGKYFENGELFSGAGSAATGGKAAVITIEQIDQLKAYVYPTEQFYTLIKEGTKVSLTSSIYPGRVFPGTVNIVYPTLDKASRTFTVEIVIPNKDGALRPGMYGTISFDLGETETLIIPVLAVMKLPGSNDRYVFLNEGGKAKRVTVTMGRRFGDMIEIFSSEVKEGDELVVTGQGKLIDGAALQVVK